jgi:hypothetical protein
MNVHPDVNFEEVARSIDDFKRAHLDVTEGTPISKRPKAKDPEFVSIEGTHDNFFFDNGTHDN